MSSTTEKLLTHENTLFMLCDMQEKFRNAILHFTEILSNTNKLVQCGKILDIPIVVTEQYPKGLGSTVTELDICHATGVHAKTDFSMLIPEIRKELSANPKIAIAVLFGIEAHVCVEQTAIDLKNCGYDVYIVADCTSSRSQEDRLLAFKRLQQMGCYISTSESIIFKILKSKDHPKFNEIRKLVSQSSAPTGLVSF